MRNMLNDNDLQSTFVGHPQAAAAPAKVQKNVISHNSPNSPKKPITTQPDKTPLPAAAVSGRKNTVGSCQQTKFCYTPQVPLNKDSMPRLIPPPGRIVCALGFSLLLALFPGCEKKSAPPPPAPPEVQFITLAATNMPVFEEWIGTLDGYVNAQIRAQVTGYLLKQCYTEGGKVKKGDLLFQIDPRPFQAALDQAGPNWLRTRPRWARPNWT